MMGSNHEKARDQYAQKRRDKVQAQRSHELNEMVRQARMAAEMERMAKMAQVDMDRAQQEAQYYASQQTQQIYGSGSGWFSDSGGHYSEESGQTVFHGIRPGIPAPPGELWVHFPEDGVWRTMKDPTRYTDADGRTFVTSTQTNTIKATVHMAGHFPIGWMMEAFERAEKSDTMIRIELEKGGVTVIGQEGDNYETHTLSWTMMEKAEVNPIPLAIETVEKHLDTLGRLKAKVKAA